MARPERATHRMACEWGIDSHKQYKDPFNALELDVHFTHESGTEYRVPAFWAGDHHWRVRFAPPEAGSYTYRSVCTDADNQELNGDEGSLEAGPYTGDNLLLSRGPLSLGGEPTRFMHEDGTAFFWLGDTWWMGLCHRWTWPEDIQLLAADRKQKGFTVIQIIAGLYPDMLAFDPRGANESGFPWDPQYEQINPAYFDAADLRIQWLVRCGLVPCIFACWGWFYSLMGEQRMKQHWRNLVARWGAYPVVWCLAGEGQQIYYLTKTPDEDRARQLRGWTELARYVREIDPYRRLLTIHPASLRDSREQIEDPQLIDFGMLQLSHRGHEYLGDQMRILDESVRRSPPLAIVNAEGNYEGIKGGHLADVQRFSFWSSMLLGAAGFTYGANGMWQINRREEPFGPSPHGASWGDTSWEEAYQLPGGNQVALGSRILRQLPWHRFTPHLEWVRDADGVDNLLRPVAAGIPQECRVVYLPVPLHPQGARPTVLGIEHDNYEARFVSTENGRDYDLGRVTPDASGEWMLAPPPIMHDLLLILQRPS